MVILTFILSIVSSIHHQYLASRDKHLLNTRPQPPACSIDRVVVIVPAGREAYCAEEIVAVEGFRKVAHYEAVGNKFDRWLDIVHMQKAI